MDSPFNTVAEQLKTELSGKFADSVKTTGTLDASMRPVDFHAKSSMPGTFAPSETAPTEAPVEAAEAPQSRAEVAPKAEPLTADPRMQKVIAEAQRVRAERDAVKAERAQMQADLAELARYRQLKAIAKEDPVAWAEEGGYKPDEYATTLMEKGSMSPERRKILEQQKELNEIKSWKQSFEQQQAQQQTQSYYQTVVGGMREFAESAGDAYDLVRRTNSYDKVLQLQQQQFEKAQALGEPFEPLPYEDAFAIVESELEKQYAPVLESPKFRSRLGEGAVPTAPGASLQHQATRKPVGINSKMRASTVPPKPLTEADRLAKAGDLFLNQILGRRG